MKIKQIADEIEKIASLKLAQAEFQKLGARADAATVERQIQALQD